MGLFMAETLYSLSMGEGKGEGEMATRGGKLIWIELFLAGNFFLTR
jgi:hypothetical protein